MIKGINLVIQWKAKVLHLKDCSLCSSLAYHILSGKATVSMKTVSDKDEAVYIIIDSQGLEFGSGCYSG